MKVGELFINLGITGAQKTRETLVTTKNGLVEVHGSALAMKAAIAGALFALERMTASSNAAGTNLLNTSNLLGVSTDAIQEYQYAARQAGVSNESLVGTFKTLQTAMAKMQLGEAPPQWAPLLSMGLGESLFPDKEALDEYAKYPQKLLQKLQQYALNPKIPAGIKNEVLKSFGLGDDMNSALLRGMFTPKILAKAPKYSRGEVESLDRNRRDWANLGNKIEMVYGRLNAKHGGEIVQGLDKIVDAVGRLADKFLVLADRVKVFDMIKSALDVVTFMAESATAVTDVASGKSKGAEDPKLQKFGTRAEQFAKDHPWVSKMVEWMEQRSVLESLSGFGSTDESRKKMIEAAEEIKKKAAQGGYFKGPPEKPKPMPDNIVPEPSSIGKKGAFNVVPEINKLAMEPLNSRMLLSPEFLANTAGVVNNTNFNSTQSSSTVSPSITITQSNTFQTADDPKEAVDRLTRELQLAYGQMNALNVRA